MLPCRTIGRAKRTYVPELKTSSGGAGHLTTKHRTEMSLTTSISTSHSHLHFFSQSPNGFTRGSNDGAPRALNILGAGRVPFAQAMDGRASALTGLVRARSGYWAEGVPPTEVASVALQFSSVIVTYTVPPIWSDICYDTALIPSFSSYVLHSDPRSHGELGEIPSMPIVALLGVPAAHLKAVVRRGP